MTSTTTTTFTAKLTYLFSGVKAHSIAGPLLILMILGMMVLPLPAFLLDMMFTFNIALSIMVLLVSIHTLKPLDFAVFPTVLLLSTLLRLSLNVASTRIVLMEGHKGPDAAGKVIEAFGHYLVGGNYTVGIVVFIILVVINFMVITKGAGRIAEVSARFTLDAMPGKQMAIDADLNAGLIGEEEAGKRRTTIAQEAEFYGSMDGASKFVRGDAIAGILILFINVIGGLIIGMLQHDLDMATAAKSYTLLAIGDGLVAQIPALIISTAAGLVVSRVGTDQNISTQLAGQLFSQPQVLILTAAIIGLMGLIPGMPHIAFLLLAAVLGGGAYLLTQRSRRITAQAPAMPAAQPEIQDASWDDVMPVDILGLEVGYRLIPLVDGAQDGELLRRIKGVRKKFAQEIGYLPPPVHIRDNLELRPNGYRIALKGVVIGAGDVNVGQYLAINPGSVGGTLPGLATTDPAFGLPAVWIEAHQREQAQMLGYTVVDAGTVVATHLNHLVHGHAAELLGRTEVQQLLDRLAKESPKLIEDLIPKLLSLSSLQKVLQNLLEENVHIRDMRTIVDALTEHAGRVQDPHELTALVRIALGRAIVQQIWPQAGELQVMALDSGLERLLTQALQASPNGTGIEPGLADTLLREASGASQRQEQVGLVPVLLVPAPLRTLLARFLRRAVPQLKILSHAEVPDSSNIKVTSILGARA
ncbi:flagellar biosynthesis protein FlhA [Nitrosospira briensis]|uniref:Flagellar biosynthesis protein FlhA n=1 Tax=Nitrosospira briensis TaxID=35799 RepID=A0A1I4Y6E0_9PROT|nr:flagellar biosynthesis protein FlhA [Nitrosospira briensis]SFN33652.1 flagellar biosynthesis protein FlhA [Nitrosospira briensis]